MLGLGADVGPMAICDQPSLPREAGPRPPRHGPEVQAAPPDRPPDRPPGSLSSLIVGQAADRMPTPIIGPAGDLRCRPMWTPPVARVAGGAATPAPAWQAVLKQAAAAAQGS
jgi:hypothetical protein